MLALQLGTYTELSRFTRSRCHTALPCTALLQKIGTGHLFKLRLVTSMTFFPSSSGFIINGGNFTNFNFQTDSEDPGQSMSI